jgi:uncharacterized protein
MPSPTSHPSTPTQTAPKPSSAITTPYGPVRRLVRRTPLISFLVLSSVLSWWPGALQAAGVGLPGPPIAGVGPFLAVLIVLGLTQGSAGIGRLLRSMVQWRIPARAYMAGLCLPLLVSGSAIAVTIALGAARPSGSDLALVWQVPVMALLVLLIPPIGGAWEEPGWRGFALGRLEARFGAIAGPLVLGGLHVFWHLPLFITGDIVWTDVLVIVAASVVMAKVFHAGRNSVLIAMLMHAMNNAVGGSYASQLFHGHDLNTLGLATAAGWWLIAGGILIRARRNRARIEGPESAAATAGARP